jgi:hypothetical protein
LEIYAEISVRSTTIAHLIVKKVHLGPHVQMLIVIEAAVIPLIGEIRPSKFGGAERRISAILVFTGSNTLWV